jgi:1-deoxy-D-xylulose-5-phosphate reductoisomerase
MIIPIFNTLYEKNKFLKTSRLNIEYLNKLEFSKLSSQRFPVINIIKKLPKKTSLFETVLVSANDELVKLYLEKKIKFTDISDILINLSNTKEFIIYKKIQPRKISDIIKLNKYVRFKINLKSV